MAVTRRNFVKAAFGASAAIASGAALAGCTSGTPAQTKETEAAASAGVWDPIVTSTIDEKDCKSS